MMVRDDGPRSCRPVARQRGDSATRRLGTPVPEDETVPPHPGRARPGAVKSSIREVEKRVSSTTHA
jgi:hypothetical protein